MKFYFGMETKFSLNLVYFSKSYVRFLGPLSNEAKKKKQVEPKEAFSWANENLFFSMRQSWKWKERKNCFYKCIIKKEFHQTGIIFVRIFDVKYFLKNSVNKMTQQKIFD